MMKIKSVVPPWISRYLHLDRRIILIEMEKQFESIRNIDPLGPTRKSKTIKVN